MCVKQAVSVLVQDGKAVPVCPEVLGGLPIPRAPAEMQGGDGMAVLEGRARVVNSRGEDVTENYVAGAKAALAIALQAGCTKAILKARSPSCGAGVVYDGTFTGSRTAGDGVLAALLRKHGFEVVADDEVTALAL